MNNTALRAEVRSTNNTHMVIVSSFFRKFNFCHLVSGSQPAMISDSSSSSGLER